MKRKQESVGKEEKKCIEFKTLWNWDLLSINSVRTWHKLKGSCWSTEAVVLTWIISAFSPGLQLDGNSVRVCHRVDFPFFLFFSLSLPYFALCNIGDLISLTRDWICAPCIGSAGIVTTGPPERSFSCRFLKCQRIPLGSNQYFFFFWNYVIISVFLPF